MNDKILFFQNLPRKQSNYSPAIETYKPGSRQYEADSHHCSGWPGYWEGESSWGGMAGNVDQIAERIPQLGGVAEGTVSMAASRALSNLGREACDAINERSEE